jgi:SAM-dependent methyltransferase
MAAGEQIEGVDEPLRAAGKGSRWEQFRLPVELSGRTFLDVGCWEGMHCAEAVRRDAEQVVGIDLCTSEDLAANVDRYGFDFLQMDIFSEKWLELGEFDVVLCSGVLYHVENVMSLLFRLRKVVRELLVLETGITRLQPEKPMMIFHGQGEGTNNPSNWWTPNRLCLEQMLNAAGFEGVSVVWEEERHEHYSRACAHAIPTGHLEHSRILPRKQARE